MRVRASAGDFFDGTRLSANVTLRIRASRYLGAETLVDYNENWNAPTFSAREPQDRQLIVKLTYLWQR